MAFGTKRAQLRIVMSEAAVEPVDQDAGQGDAEDDGDCQQQRGDHPPIPAKPMKASDRMPASMSDRAVPCARPGTSES